MICLGCGCSELRPCAGGCTWVADYWCSSCADPDDILDPETPPEREAELVAGDGDFDFDPRREA